MMDNLLGRNMIVVHTRLFAFVEEMVDHLLHNCKVARDLWVSIIAGFECCWVFP